MFSAKSEGICEGEAAENFFPLQGGDKGNCRGLCSHFMRDIVVHEKSAEEGSSKRESIGK